MNPNPDINELSIKLNSMLTSLKDDDLNPFEYSYRQRRAQEFPNLLNEYLKLNTEFEPVPEAGFTDNYVYELTRRACEQDPLFDSLLSKSEELTEEEEVYVKLHIRYFKARVQEAVKYYLALKAQH